MFISGLCFNSIRRHLLENRFICWRCVCLNNVIFVVDHVTVGKCAPRQEKLCVKKAGKRDTFPKHVGRLVFRLLFTQSYTPATTTLPSLLKQSTLYILIGKDGTIFALIEIDSPGSFIPLDYVKRHQIKIKSAVGNVSMAWSPLNASIKRQCTVNLNL